MRQTNKVVMPCIEPHEARGSKARKSKEMFPVRQYFHSSPASQPRCQPTFSLFPQNDAARSLLWTRSTQSVQSLTSWATIWNSHKKKMTTKQNTDDFVSDEITSNDTFNWPGKWQNKYFLCKKYVRCVMFSSCCWLSVRGKHLRQSNLRWFHFVSLRHMGQSFHQHGHLFSIFSS